MPKLEDLNESERQRANVDKNGTVLCIWCNKNPAKVSEYGMLRKCETCEKEKYNVIVILDEPGGRRTY